MAKQWQGKSYNENWEPVDERGIVIGPKDFEADQANPPVQSPWSGAATPAPAAPAAPAAPSAMQSNVQNKLLSELNLSPTVDTKDPAFQQQIEANRFTADRTADRTRAALAQRLHAQGTGASGGLDVGIGRILADQGAQEQGFEAQLLNQFRNQNLERMGRALQLGTGLLSQEQEQALRGALTREGYGLQRELGLKDLDFRRDALGQQMGLSQAQLDQQAMLALLGA